MPKARLYAHRGAAADLPENTIPSFRLALDVGANALEMDVHLTRDGHVVVAHDPTGARMAGVPQAIRASSLDDVRAWDVGRRFHRRATLENRVYRVPTLEEVLAEFPGIPINIDAKHPEVVESLVAQVRRFGPRALENVLLTSFDTRTIRAIRKLGYEGQTGLSRSEVMRLVLLPNSAHRVFRLRGQAAQIPTRAGPFALDTAALVSKIHALGLLVHYWTINDVASATRLLRLGADGIMTDDPRTIAPVFSSAPFV